MNRRLNRWLKNHKAKQIWSTELHAELGLASPEITCHELNDHTFLTIEFADAVEIVTPVTVHQDLQSKLSALTHYCGLD